MYGCNSGVGGYSDDAGAPFAYECEDPSRLVIGSAIYFILFFTEVPGVSSSRAKDRTTKADSTPCRAYPPVADPIEDILRAFARMESSAGAVPIGQGAGAGALRMVELSPETPIGIVFEPGSLKVKTVEIGSQASSVAVAPGSIIRTANSAPVQTQADVVSAIKSAKRQRQNLTFELEEELLTI